MKTAFPAFTLALLLAGCAADDQSARPCDPNCYSRSSLSPMRM